MKLNIITKTLSGIMRRYLLFTYTVIIIYSSYFSNIYNCKLVLIWFLLHVFYTNNRSVNFENNQYVLCRFVYHIININKR
jgi:hypothetical protein